MMVVCAFCAVVDLDFAEGCRCANSRHADVASGVLLVKAQEVKRRLKRMNEFFLKSNLKFEFKVTV